LGPRPRAQRGGASGGAAASDGDADDAAERSVTRVQVLAPMPLLTADGDTIRGICMLPGEEREEVLEVTNRGHASASHVQVWARYGARRPAQLLFTTAAAALSGSADSSSGGGGSEGGADDALAGCMQVDGNALSRQLRTADGTPCLSVGAKLRMPLRIRAPQSASAAAAQLDATTAAANANGGGTGGAMELAICYSAAGGAERWLAVPVRARVVPGLRLQRVSIALPPERGRGLVADCDAPACRVSVTLRNDGPLAVEAWRRAGGRQRRRRALVLRHRDPCPLRKQYDGRNTGDRLYDVHSASTRPAACCISDAASVSTLSFLRSPLWHRFAGHRSVPDAYEEESSGDGDDDGGVRGPLAPLPLLRWEAAVLRHLQTAFTLCWRTVSRDAAATEHADASTAAAAAEPVLQRCGVLTPPVRMLGPGGVFRETGAVTGLRAHGGGAPIPYVPASLAPLVLPTVRLAVLPRRLPARAGSGSGAGGGSSEGPEAFPELAPLPSAPAAAEPLLHAWHVTVPQFTRVPIAALVARSSGGGGGGDATLRLCAEVRGRVAWGPAGSPAVAWAGLLEMPLPPCDGGDKSGGSVAAHGAVACFLRPGTFRIGASVQTAHRTVSCAAPMVVIVQPAAVAAAAAPKCVDLGLAFESGNKLVNEGLRPDEEGRAEMVPEDVAASQLQLDELGE
ncbi:hypothetical protein JKP88DRAFT_298345, partial [Tribonema minus]